MKYDFHIDDLRCQCFTDERYDGRIAYILYPMDNMLDSWIQTTSEKYGVDIVVITGMDWQNVFSPWPAAGVPAGSADFKGESPEFLLRLRDKIIPEIEQATGISKNAERTLVGVSMSGLFALWQWMICDTFENIASLSGSFWYDGFLKWISETKIPHKNGTAYFLLGKQEAKSGVRTFDSVAANTSEIIKLLRMKGIRVVYESVSGNHYSNPIPRLDAAFSALYTYPESCR